MTLSPMLALTEGGAWRPGIGDPTVMGWLTVAAYAVAATLCLRESWDEAERERAVFWAAAGGLMLLLGVNKQLDLQTWLTFTGRGIARAHGWYGERRTVQFFFVLAVALGGLWAFGALWRLAREHGRDLGLPLAGVFLVLCFVIIRAASFHHIDQLLSLRLKGFKLNWLFELGGIFVIIAGAIRQRLAIARENAPD